MQAGMVSKAASALQPSKLADLGDAAVRAELKSKRAEAAEFEHIPQLPNDAPQETELPMDALPELLEAPQMARKLESARQLAKDKQMGGAYDRERKVTRVLIKREPRGVPVAVRAL